MSKSKFKPVKSSQIISHGIEKTQSIDKYKSRLESADNLVLPLEDELLLLEQLTEFDFGKFLLKNKGLNGYWTSYIINGYRQSNKLHSLENWIIRKAPLVKATRERSFIFTEQLQKYLEDKSTLASIPCGVMDDLLTLDYAPDLDMQLIGIDLDQKAINLAKENAVRNNLINCTKFVKKNAWSLGVVDQYNIISSNGLNIYESNDQKLIELYKQFYQALKTDGILITSFITPPPELSENSIWENYEEKDLIRQQAIFGDILQATWQAYRTESQMRKHLEAAGFSIIEVIYDSCKIFPTIVAKK